MRELKHCLDDHMAAAEHLDERRLFTDIFNGPIRATSSVNDLGFGLGQLTEHPAALMHYLCGPLHSPRTVRLTFVYKLFRSTNQSTGRNVFGLPVGLHKAFMRIM